MAELGLLLAACALGTYAWRGLGVFLSGRISASSALFTWVACVAYAMVAGLVTRIIVLPSGLLATSLLGHRLVACAIGLGTYYLCRRNLLAGVAAGAVAFALLNALRGASLWP